MGSRMPSVDPSDLFADLAIVARRGGRASAKRYHALTSDAVPSSADHRGDTRHETSQKFPLQPHVFEENRSTAISASPRVLPHTQSA
ncbi:unnamed protein product [Soboliphyme baturini]|uniref:Uncharacterized protein n=1 Tax=Soboliphyme baturini TaxID=241478 RepID=A0A183J1K0_9BILA|nr:unnamed protein product [Soboliphyme baturini]